MPKPGRKSGPFTVARRSGGDRGGPISGGMPKLSERAMRARSGDTLGGGSMEPWRQSRIGGLQGSPTFVEKYKSGK